jgi:colanic acid/amylovoran biosynthesis glycosyltransferase
MAKELGISGRVHFSGRLGEQETLQEIARADILVLASFMEGLPIVLMEAMAMGTAVIASRVAGIPELVEDSQAGLLFTPSNWDELAACIGRLIDDEPLRLRLVRHGREVVGKGFDIHRSAEQLRELFGGQPC